MVFLALLAGGLAWWFGLSPSVGIDLSAPGPVIAAPRAAAAVPARRTPAGQTSVRMVDAGGNAVEGVPVYDQSEDGMFEGPFPLGHSDADGVFVPATFPVEINVGGWPATPERLSLRDDGQEHVITVVEACELALSWDPPPSPPPTSLVMPGAPWVPITPGNARLRLPCGELTVTPQTRFNEPERGVQLVDNVIDTRDGHAHLSWEPREGLTICVEDLEGRRLVDATVSFSWPRGDCWGLDPMDAFFDVEVSAPGYLTADLRPELPLVWLKEHYDVVLEDGLTVNYTCLQDDGTVECKKKDVAGAACISAETPDGGPCDAERQSCVCPDAADAHLVCTFGRFAGERAEIHDGAAQFERTGTASITVPSEEFCGAMLTRRDESTSVWVGLLRCEAGAPSRDRLTAGNYELVTSGLWGYAYWSDLRLADGEDKVFPLRRPTGRGLEVEWLSGEPSAENLAAMVVVRTPSLRVSYHDPASVVVPPGAEVWVCSQDGCCHYDDPPAQVSCEPSPAVIPPMPEM